MPIFHLSVRTVSRGAGRSAVASAAYRAGARLRCDRTGRVFDYSRRAGVVATRVVVPRSETTIDRQTLWDRAEAAETRSNSTVAREFEIALPSELDARAREALALGFAEALSARYGIVVDVAVHQPSKIGDNRNHHAHLLTSTRRWGADGAFGRKVRLLDDRRTGPAEITAIRALWAEMANAALTSAGVMDTVDHRSHLARGLPDAPGQKLGPNAVGFERRTGAVSRRRADQDAERAAHGLLTPSPHEGKDSVGAGQAESDRHRVQRLVLGQLRSTFVAATAAAMAGRAHPVLQGIPMSTLPRRQGSAAPVHRFAARRSSSSSQIRSLAPVAPGIPASRAGTRRQKGYDEAEEVAAMIRRVERELEAEHMAQLAAREAEAKRAASLADRERLRNAFGIGFGRLPGLSGAGIRRRSDPVANGLVRRSVEDQGVDRMIDVRSSPGRDVGDAAMPEVEPSTSPDLTRRDLAVMLARELGRRHKRSRARLSRLAEAAGLDEAVFATAVAAREDITFDPAAIANEPMLAATWRAWEAEDRAKQRDRQDEMDAPPPTTVTEAASPADKPAGAGPDRVGPEETREEGGSDVTSTTAPPYQRRDVVIDRAILLIARGRWSNDIGDALAGLLRTQRGWVWREAHRVCRARYGTDRPERIPSEILGTIARAVIAGARKDPQVRRVLGNIDRGRIGRGLG